MLGELPLTGLLFSVGRRVLVGPGSGIRLPKTPVP
jgi:hypothetical protein